MEMKKGYWEINVYDKNGEEIGHIANSAVCYKAQEEIDNLVKKKYQIDCEY